MAGNERTREMIREIIRRNKALEEKYYEAPDMIDETKEIFGSTGEVDDIRGWKTNEGDVAYLAKIGMEYI